MKITNLPIKSLVILPELSGRNKKEISANAKALAPMMEAAGGWDEAQPGQIFIRDGKPHLLAGFTRAAACEISGIKNGWFAEVKDDPSSIRTACLRTNLGKPISAFEQGRIYTAMRDGTNPETAEKGAVILAPMEIKSIAAETGYTSQHIADCIAIFSETPEIGELIQEGKVSSGIVVKARQLVKADGKRLAFLKAAVAEAKRDGKECATMQHLKAVQPDFVQLKVETPDKPKDDKKTAENGDTADKEEKPAGEASEKQDKPSPQTPQSTMDLGTPEPARPLDTTETQSAILTVLLAHGIDAKKADEITAALIGAGVTFTSPF